MSFRKTKMCAPAETLQLRITNLAWSFGLATDYVKEKLLPEWLSNLVVEDEPSLWEATAYLAQAFDLKTSEVIKTNGRILRKNALPYLCKNANVQCDRNQMPTVLVASRLASLAAEACNVEYVDFPSDANVLRQELLASAEVIDFEVAAEYCWRHGVPVLAVQNLPDHAPEGIVFKCDSRPAIVLCLHEEHDAACLLFDLLHEMGHIALGHLGEFAIVDDEINPRSRGSVEKLANEFAFGALTSGDKLHVNISFSNELGCVSFAREAGEKYSVDPKWILTAANFSDKTSDTVEKCLRTFGESVSPRKTIRKLADKYLNEHSLKEFDRDLLDRLLVT